MIGGRVARRAGVAGLAAAWCLLGALPASAQQEGPIPWVAADLRGATPGFKQDIAVAAPHGLTADDLPGRGLGFDAGVHVYPIRWRWLTLGLGGNLHLSRASRGPAEEDSAPAGHDVSVRFRALSPQMSFNFGHAGGWSYLSGGIATSTLRYTIDGTPVDEAVPARKTINYGGGARWFIKDHVAFTFDVRFYAIGPHAAGEAAGTRASPRMTLVVLSAGVSFK